MRRARRARPPPPADPPGRAITDWPGDVAEAADLLQLPRFPVAGAPRGAAWDMVLLGRPWGFSLREIEPEVHLLVIDHMSDLIEAFRQAAPPR